MGYPRRPRREGLLWNRPRYDNALPTSRHRGGPDRDGGRGGVRRRRDLSLARLLWNGDYAVDHFGVRFDWIVDDAASLHVAKDDLETVFGKLHDVLSPSGTPLLCCELRLPVSVMEDLGWRLCVRRHRASS